MPYVADADTPLGFRHIPVTIYPGLTDNDFVRCRRYCLTHRDQIEAHDEVPAIVNRLRWHRWLFANTLPRLALRIV